MGGQREDTAGVTRHGGPLKGRDGTEPAPPPGPAPAPPRDPGSSRVTRAGRAPSHI